MPELPEVSVVINYLKNNILNKKITNIEVIDQKFLKNILINEFKDKLISNNIIDIIRKGKYILFLLSNGMVLLTHLRMEGKFFIYDKNKYSQSKSKHDYLIFELNKKELLIYNDTRKFGTFHLYSKLELNESKELKNVGPDPLDDDFDINEFYKNLNKKSKSIKESLMEQKIISGIGNIYASEILFASRIYPFTKSNQISIDQAKEIIINARKILKKSIKHNGTTWSSFKFGNHSGSYQDYLEIYGRTSQKCRICNSLIVKEIKNNRSTYYCPMCQK